MKLLIVVGACVLSVVASVALTVYALGPSVALMVGA